VCHSTVNYAYKYLGEKCSIAKLQLLVVMATFMVANSNSMMAMLDHGNRKASGSGKIVGCSRNCHPISLKKNI